MLGGLLHGHAGSWASNSRVVTSNKPLLLARMDQSKHFALVPGLAAQRNCETLDGSYPASVVAPDAL